MSTPTPVAAAVPWHRREDTWAIVIALALVATVTAAFFLGAARAVSATAFTVPTWASGAKVAEAFQANPVAPIALFGVFLAAFSAASAVIGWDVAKYAAGFALLFLFSIGVTILGSNEVLKAWQLETPLLALLVGMLLGNAVALPVWFQSALRTEFYVKVGIVLMGATLPFTIILQAGPLAIAQATIVAVVTFAAIYLAATRLFGLDRRFGATLGAGGSICGVSAAIAIGGACRAEKSHVSVAISMVILWAVAMIFVLPFGAHRLGLAPGVAGAWIGTSEFADAAGFAAASASATSAPSRPSPSGRWWAATCSSASGRCSWRSSPSRAGTAGAPGRRSASGWERSGAASRSSSSGSSSPRSWSRPSSRRSARRPGASSRGTPSAR